MRLPPPLGIFAVIVVLASSGCTTEPLGPGTPSPADAPVKAIPAQQWAGGTITLTSRALGSLPGVILVAVDGALQLATRTDDSSFVTTLSDTLLSGTHVVTVVSHGDHPSVNVAVAGHHAVRDLGFDFQTDATPWPHWAPIGLIGGYDDTLTFVDLASGTKTRLGVQYSKLGGMPGLSSIPEHLVLTKNDTAHVYAVDVSTGSAAPAPASAEGIVLSDGNFWKGLDQLSDSVIAFVGHDGLELDLIGTAPTGTYCDISAPVNAARVILSPRKDRAGFPSRVYTCGAASLVPIFNALTGAVAFEIPGSSRLDALEFSANGGTMYAITRPNLNSPTRTLYRLGATTGALQIQMALRPDSTDVGESHLRLDPTRGRLYETSREGSDYVLHVRDALSLASVAALRANGAAAYCQQPFGGTWSSHLIIAPDGAAAWLAIEFCHGAGDHTAVFTFDLID